MRSLIVHNRYEDVVVGAEKSMLEDHGREVSLLKADTAEISGALAQVATGFNAIHGGCQAGCLLFWNEAWLKPVNAKEAAPAAERPVACPTALAKRDPPSLS